MTDKLVKTKPNGSAMQPAPFTRDQRTALRKMSDEGREAVLASRPEAEFGVSPVLPDDAKQEIARVIEQFGIRPPRGWILIKQVPAAERIGVILVPPAAEQPPEIGIVIAVGLGTIHNGQLVPPECVIGDHVTFPRFAGLPVKISGEEFTQLREDEILLISSRPGGGMR